MKMKIATRDFGEILIEEEDVITFRQAVFGFEEYARYVLLTDEEMGENFAWLQSLDEPRLCFILVRPELLRVEYAPQLPLPFQKMLGEKSPMCWLVAVITEEFCKSTVNLKSPIFISSSTQLAAQVILDEEYPIRYPLLPQKEA